MFFDFFDFLDCFGAASQRRAPRPRSAPLGAHKLPVVRLLRLRDLPQGWVQDGMYMATWTVIIQFMVKSAVSSV